MSGTTERMFVLLKQSKDVAEQRRIQAVLMSASDAFPLAKIAELTGLGVHLVRVHARDFCVKRNPIGRTGLDVEVLGLLSLGPMSPSCSC